ncbi:MAG: aldose epimerase family protein [Pseudomonadota bacterium]
MMDQAKGNTQQPIANTITNGSGFSVSIIDVGATIGSITIPQSDRVVDAVVSYRELSSYLTDPHYLGSTVGPVANRIRNAAISLKGIEYRLDANDSDRGNCLHGGSTGLHRQRFTLECEENEPIIRCSAKLEDGVGGFPGNRGFHVTYHFVDDWSLAIDFKVTTDRETVVNLANHTYFNLGGPLNDHKLRVFSESYTPVDDSMIPTGELRDVDGSAFDLREMQTLGNRTFDHNFVLGESERALRLASQLESPMTGLQLSVLTTQPAVQVYTGDYLSNPFNARQGICFETQGFPDAPNQPSFPSILLEAGATYSQRTVYQFAGGVKSRAR